jgi:hypothetical protein
MHAAGKRRMEARRGIVLQEGDGQKKAATQFESESSSALLSFLALFAKYIQLLSRIITSGNNILFNRRLS